MNPELDFLRRRIARLQQDESDLRETIYAVGAVRHPEEERLVAELYRGQVAAAEERRKCAARLAELEARG